MMKSVGNGPLNFDGETVGGHYVVLSWSSRFVAIEPPTPGGLQLLLDAAKTSTETK